jgi:hypothetical protein
MQENRERERIFVDLAKVSQESFLSRRSFEWKVAFGLWTGIGIWTHFVLSNAGISTIPTQYSFQFLGAIYLGIALVWLFFWQIPNRKAFEQDNLFKHYYMKHAEGRKPSYPLEVGYWQMLRNPWTYGQFGFTVILLVGSYFTICYANHP